MARLLALLLAGSVALALPGSAGADAGHEPAATVAAVDQPCPSTADYTDPIVPDKVLTGQFTSDRQGSYVMLPVDVPPGQTALRVKYCYDQPPAGTDSHTLDLGLYEPRSNESRPWALPEFRGWGGSSHPDVTLSPQGYSSEARYLAGERVPGMTTRAFEPGPIPRGEWAVELGLASIVPPPTDPDGVGYRVEIDWSDRSGDAEDPYRPAAYDERPAIDRPGWYAGDFHVHAEHSALGDAPMSEVFDYAFGPPGPDGAGLDFITLSDYVSGTAWDEIGRYQDQYPRSLIIRSAEVITYQGHANSHANTGVVDYRLGPLLQKESDGTLTRLRRPRPASTIFDRVHSAGGFTQINHPTIFPSSVPAFRSLCRGCPWDHSDQETDYSQVDAIEIATGPPGFRNPAGGLGPNPFTVTAIEFWEDALADGHRIAAVGSSDSHHAGDTPNPVTQAPVGTATTVVRAPELSEDGIDRGVSDGHTYVKVFGASGPDLRFSAVPVDRAGSRAIMGDVLRAARGRFEVRVMGGSTPERPGPLELLVIRDGAPFRTVPVTSDDFRYQFTASRPGRYRLQVQRGTAIEAVSSPIYMKRRPPGEDPGGDDGAGPGDGQGEDGDGDGVGGPSDGGADGSAPNGGLGSSASDGDGGVESAAGTEVSGGSEGGSLPFTGLTLAVVAGLGLVLLALGGAIRRRSRPG